jgi:parallel beta-helix repeat protein
MTEINIFNNTLVRNWNYGFYLNQIYTSFFFFNHVYENGGIGFYFFNSSNCLVDSNDVHDNDYNGISLVLTHGFYICANSFHSNDMHGIQLSDSHGNEIRCNSVFENSGYGIILSNSNDNIILNNSFYLNIEGNARDDGDMNRFSESWEGNWWDDWNGTDVYYIEGEAENVDRAPSLYTTPTPPTNKTTPIIEFDFSTRIIIALCVVTVGVLAMTFWYRERK